MRLISDLNVESGKLAILTNTILFYKLKMRGKYLVLEVTL